jgi:hypothetical protein
MDDRRQGVLRVLRVPQEVAVIGDSNPERSDALVAVLGLPPDVIRGLYVALLDETPVVGWLPMACELARQAKRGMKRAA